MKEKQGNLIRDFSIIVFSILTAFLLVRSGFVETALSASQPSRLFASFIAGIFFTSIFTTIPATVALGELALSGSLIWVSFSGALGALVGDFLIFRFVRDSVAEDFFELLSKHRKHRLRSIFRMRVFRAVMPFLGALIIASPLPDELGLVFLGISKLKTRYFLPLSFVLNFFGILIIGLIAKSLVSGF